MRRFFITLYAIAVLLHVPFAYMLAALLRPLLPWSTTLALVCAGLLAALFHGRVQLVRWDRPLPRWRRIAEEAYYVHWCALLPWVLFATLIWGLFEAISSAPLNPWWSSTEQALILAYPAAFLLSFWGVVVRRRWVRTRRLSIAVEGLPEAFSGYRIAQLSDIHLGSLCPRERVARWVETTNALEVDMVALTGDYVTTGTRFHQDIAAALGALQARDGVYAIMGNHDYFGEGQPLMGLLRATGITLLRNERTLLSRGGEQLALAGVDDIYTGRIDIAAAFDGHTVGAPLIMLAHDPRSFDDLAKRGASLVLSGHTHWGQIGVPFFADKLNYARTLMRDHAGLISRNGAQLYVHPGLGTTGPPLRLGTWPEITVIELRAGKSSV